MELVKDRVTGLWYRPHTWDLDAMRRADEFARCVEPGDVVCDIGSHIGSTVRIAIEAGAAKVHAFEPHPETFSILDRNFVDNTDVALHDCAVIDGHELNAAPLYANPNSTIGHTLLKKAWTKNAATKLVTVIPFKAALGYEAFTVLKIDCEGAETTFNWADVTKNVRCMLVEFHLRGPSDWPQLARTTYDRIVKSGWFPNAPAPDEAVEWNSTHVFRR